MKLRIKGNSLRLRISRAEMAHLLGDGQIEETVRFGAQADAKLTYALLHRTAAREIGLESSPQRVTIVLSTEATRGWSEGDRVGVYGEVQVGDATLSLTVEKDFACLDGTDADNWDAFPNPKAALVF